ncbi:MAG: lipoyl(octanoyl) transferase LipB [Acidobacteriota bacterium]
MAADGTIPPDLGPPDLGRPPRKGSSVGRELRWSWLGRVPYAETAELQQRLRRAIRADGGAEHLLLLEHEPVFTLGRNASEQDVVADRSWLAEQGIEVHGTNRGGQVTYHGPGQLVGYPIVDLDPDRRDVGRYVRDLQDVLIRTLADLGIEATRREGRGFVGVWVGDAKIASIGVHLSRWITNHGFALNVAPDLRHFGGIVACGLPDVTMTSIERELGSAPDLPALADRVARHVSEIFQRRLVRRAPP